MDSFAYAVFCMGKNGWKWKNAIALFACRHLLVFVAEE
jgi:hypothetical protein